MDLNHSLHEDLDQCQQDTATLLKRHSSVKPSRLESSCPLDYGNHSAPSSVDATLGSLQFRPAEIKQLALSFLNIQTLLTFRAMSRSAMTVVDTSTAYRKVLGNESNTLRMTIAIRDHHTYTISDLLAALYTRTCADCGTSAQHLDVFTLRSVCLGLNGYCDGSAPPMKVTTSGYMLQSTIPSLHTRLFIDEHHLGTLPYS
jgi:hypothetical protein